jgi:N-sulfoglucosamine sulfohydrolase
VLSRWVQDGRLWLALQAARSIQLIGQRAKPLVPVIRATIERLEAPPGSPRTYLDFNFASFTGWALEVALENCGEPLDRAPGPI